ncbi:hypothetical protein DFH06DRAFT_1151162 [Mycena polygramma]|nr:hypothetical protein DFH06DRAFT_1151162 [Mycena polygramma]
MTSGIWFKPGSVLRRERSTDMGGGGSGQDCWRMNAMSPRDPHRTVYGYDRKNYGLYGDILAVTVTVNSLPEGLTVRSSSSRELPTFIEFFAIPGISAIPIKPADFALVFSSQGPIVVGGGRVFESGCDLNSESRLQVQLATRIVIDFVDEDYSLIFPCQYTFFSLALLDSYQPTGTRTFGLLESHPQNDPDGSHLRLIYGRKRTVYGRIFTVITVVYPAVTVTVNCSSEALTVRLRWS